MDECRFLFVPCHSSCLIVVFYSVLHTTSLHPASSRGLSLVEQLQTAGVAVVAADLAVGMIEVGGVGKGWRERVVI